MSNEIHAVIIASLLGGDTYDTYEVGGYQNVRITVEPNGVSVHTRNFVTFYPMHRVAEIQYYKQSNKTFEELTGKDWSGTNSQAL